MNKILKTALLASALFTQTVNAVPSQDSQQNEFFLYYIAGVADTLDSTGVICVNGEVTGYDKLALFNNIWGRPTEVLHWPTKDIIYVLKKAYPCKK